MTGLTIQFEISIYYSPKWLPKFKMAENGPKKYKNIQKSQYNSKTFIDNSKFNSLLERYYNWTENQVENNFIFRTNMASEIQNGRKGTKFSEKLL